MNFAPCRRYVADQALRPYHRRDCGAYGRRAELDGCSAQREAARLCAYKVFFAMFKKIIEVALKSFGHFAHNDLLDHRDIILK